MPKGKGIITHIEDQPAGQKKGVVYSLTVEGIVKNELFFFSDENVPKYYEGKFVVFVAPKDVGVPNSCKLF